MIELLRPSKMPNRGGSFWHLLVTAAQLRKGAPYLSRFVEGQILQLSGVKIDHIPDIIRSAS